MTPEILNRANGLTADINCLRAWRSDVESESFANKNRRGLPQNILDAGKSAMLAVIDEELDAMQRELDAL